MKRKSLLNLESEREDEELEIVVPARDLHAYTVRSNIGVFSAETFLEAISLAKKIFTIRGSWALIVY